MTGLVGSTGMRLRQGLVVGLLALLAAGEAAAEPGPSNFPFTPIQLALLPNLQVAPRHWPVFGVRIDVGYGVQDRVTGIDLGLFNDVRSELNGVAVGIANVGEGRVRGLRLGVANALEGSVVGVDLGVANQAIGSLKGAQLGVANVIEDGVGCQIGLINSARSLRGLQLGLVNVNGNGFLPFTIFVNYGR